LNDHPDLKGDRPNLFFSDAAQAGNPKAAAKSRVRRMTPQLRAAIPPAIRREEALALAADPVKAEAIAATAKVITLTPDGVVTQRIQHADLGDLSQMRPVRRIGTYKNAPNRIAGHPHLRRGGGPPIILLLESSLELAHARIKEFDPATRAMLTQPFALMWPVGDRCMWRVPDLVVQHDDGTFVIDVKPDDPAVRDPYTMAMLELTRLTVDLVGWQAQIAGSLAAQTAANLRTIASERRTPAGLDHVVALLRERRPRCVGSALDVVGDDDDGMRALLHLFAHEVTVNLDLPILLGTTLNWSNAVDDEVEFGEGVSWNDGQNTYTIVGLAERDFELQVSVWDGGDAYHTYTVREVIRLMCEAKWLTTPELVKHADDDERLAKVSDEAYEKIVRLERALWKARTGYPTRYPPPGAKPDPDYDPSLPMSVRMQRAGDEVGLTPARLYQIIGPWKASDYDRAALIHGNTKAPHEVLSGYAPDVIEFVRAFIARQGSRSTKDAAKLKALLLVEMTEAGHEALSEYKLGQLLKELSRGQDLFGDATSRQTKGQKPTTGGRRSKSLKYAEILQVDSSQMNFMVWSPGGQEWLPVWGIFITCEATKITTVRLATTPPNARSFALALARMMMPPTVDDLPLPFQFAPANPKFLDISPDLWPTLMPNEVHQDRGPEYENGANFDLYARLGITPRLARSYTPSDKAQIEAKVGKVNRFTQLVEGHKGNSVKNRGKHPEREPLLTFQAAQAVMDAACMQSMYEPHSGLTHPMAPGKFLAPIQAYNIALKDKRIRTSSKVNPNTIFELLDLVEGTVSGNEVTADQIVYRADDPSLMKALSAGDSRVSSRPLRFRRDPNDMSRLFWRIPGTGRWQVLHATYKGTELPPFSDVLYNRMLHEQPDRRVSKQVRLNLDVELRRYVRKLQSTKTGKQELAREFARIYQAVNDPVDDAHADSQSSERENSPNLTVIDGGAEGGTGDADERPVFTAHDQVVSENDRGATTQPDDGDYELRTFTEDDFLDGGW
jgi:hypothetical protein